AGNGSLFIATTGSPVPVQVKLDRLKDPINISYGGGETIAPPTTGDITARGGDFLVLPPPVRLGRAGERDAHRPPAAGAGAEPAAKSAPVVHRRRRPPQLGRRHQPGQQQVLQVLPGAHSLGP